MAFSPDPIAELRKMSPEQRMAVLDAEICSRYGTDIAANCWLVERHRWIKDKAGKIRPLGKLKLAQKKTLAALHYCRTHEIAPRIIIGKSRKQGESTIIAADCYEEVKRHQYDALILAHDKAGVSKIFSIYQRFYKHDDLDKPQPYKGKVNLREMRFQDHDGHITVATARNVYAGTGETPQYIHASESSKWQAGEDTLTSLNQAIGDDVETTFIHESTFNGEESCFLPIWRAAYENCKLRFIDRPDGNFDVELTVTNHAEWNHFIPIFISVLDDEDARLAFLDDDDRHRFSGTLDQYERHLVDDLGATLEFLNWRRRTLKLKCKNDLEVLKQEYPTTPEEAIRASGRPRFNLEKLDSMPVEDGQVGRLKYTDGWDQRIVWQSDPQGDLTRFRDPVPGHQYIIGCDPAEGSSLEEEASDPNQRLDASVVEVFDLDNGNEETAVYHAVTTPENLAAPLVMLGRYYNDAFIVIERNSSGHTTCIKAAESYDPSLLYHEDDWDPEKTRRQRSIGHKTTSSNRDHLVSLVADAINEDDIVFHDRRTVSEHKYFVYTKTGKPAAARGHHDDHVMATTKARAGIAMARQIRKITARTRQRQAANVYAQRVQQTVDRSYL